MVNTEIRLIIFFAAEDGEALYSQQKQAMTVFAVHWNESATGTQLFFTFFSGCSLYHWLASIAGQAQCFPEKCKRSWYWLGHDEN